MDLDRGAHGGYEAISGVVYGVQLRGRLPAAFRPYLLPGAADRAGSAFALDVSYRVVDDLAAVEEIWASEPSAPSGPDGPPGGGRFALFQEPEGFGLAVSGAGRGLFRCAPGAVRIEWTPPGTGAPHYLFSYALPLWLEARGVPVLHGSAVSFGDRAIGFVGPSGVGKSVLAAELLRLGCGFLADDGLVLRRAGRGEWRCFHGPPLLRLWPSALHDRLKIAADALPRVFETVEKRQLRPTGGGGERAGSPATGLPLAAVYVLRRRPEEAAEAAERPVAISECAPREALVRLLEHGVAAQPAAALGLSARRLELLADFVEKVPVRLLEVPSGADSALRIRNAIVPDLERAAHRPHPG